MSRLLMLGDTLKTGFGTVTADLGAALLRRGTDVRFMSINEQPDRVLEAPFAGRTALVGQPDGWLDPRDPKMAGRLERMCFGGLFEDGWAPDAVLIIGDMGSLDVSPILGFIPEGFPTFHYVPIEGIGLPPAWTAVWKRIRPVAMCEFGADEIAKLGIERPPVIYHGVDTTEFWPVSPERPIVVKGRRAAQVLRSKTDCRRFFGGDPDRVWALRVDRLMPRKRYAALFRAMAPVMERHPELDLILHVRMVDEGGNLAHLLSHHPTVAARIRPTGFYEQAGGQAISRTILNALYNAADLYVTTSAEGFGLTIAEALATGLPAVGMDFSAVPEVIGPAGIAVPVGSLDDNIYAYQWATPDVPAFSAAVERLVASRGLRRELGSLGPSHVAAHFSWDEAAVRFSDLIESAPRLEAVAA